MALTYAEYWKTVTAVAGADITSNSISVAVDDVIACIYIHEDAERVATLTISNSGTGLTWNAIATQNAISNCYVRGWWARATAAESITITCDNSNTEVKSSAQSIIVHTGAHGSTPVPAGKIFSGNASTDVTQSITPTSSGSCLWMACGDWSQTNSFAAAANCTIARTVNVAGAYTGCLIRPTTQPRTDANAFTIGESDTSGKVSWIAFEVQAAASAAGGSPDRRGTEGRQAVNRASTY